MASSCTLGYMQYLRQGEGQPFHPLSQMVNTDFDRHLRQDFHFNGRDLPLEDYFQYGQQPEIGNEVAQYKRLSGLLSKEREKCKYCHQPFHHVRDRYGRITCPKLRSIVCYHCNATGDYAHTMRFCPKKNNKLSK